MRRRPAPIWSMLSLARSLIALSLFLSLSLSPLLIGAHEVAQNLGLGLRHAARQSCQSTEQSGAARRQRGT